MPYNNSRLRKILSSQTSTFFFPTTIIQNRNFEEQIKSLAENKQYLSKINNLIDSLWCGNCKKDSIIDINSNRKKFSKIGFDIPEATHKLDCSDGEFEYWSKDITISDRLIYRIHVKTDMVEILSCKGHFDYNIIQKLESNNFSAERLEEREKWLEEHKHWSKDTQRMLMPLHLKYLDIQPFSEEFRTAANSVQNKIVKTVNKEPLPKVEQLTKEVLSNRGIKGTLLNRKHNSFSR